jgi:predicted nucleic acid-binding protein
MRCVGGDPNATPEPPAYEHGMKVFLDTNVLIAASVRQHPHFSRADAVMRRCMEKLDEGIVHTHSLLEFHSAITQLPKGLAVPPAYVTDLLEQSILVCVRLVALPKREMTPIQKRAGELGLIGGIIYDFFHLSVAMRECVDRFYTFNTAHFRGLAEPGFRDRIVAP